MQMNSWNIWIRISKWGCEAGNMLKMHKCTSEHSRTTYPGMLMGSHSFGGGPSISHFKWWVFGHISQEGINVWFYTFAGESSDVVKLILNRINAILTSKKRNRMYLATYPASRAFSVNLSRYNSPQWWKSRRRYQNRWICFLATLAERTILSS